MSAPPRLSWEDHVLIHGVGTLLSGAGFAGHDHDPMVQAVLREVLPAVNADNRALLDLRAAGHALSARSCDLHARKLHWRGVLREYHLNRLTAAWSQIEDDYTARRGGAGLDI